LARRVGLGKEFQIRLRHRIYKAGGDNVTGEGTTRYLRCSCRKHSAARIVDRIVTARHVQQRRKIALAFSVRWYAADVQRTPRFHRRIERVGIAHALVPEEPEQAVLAVEQLWNIHRCPGGGSKLILMVDGPFGSGAIIEEIVGIEDAGLVVDIS